MEVVLSLQTGSDSQPVCKSLIRDIYGLRGTICSRNLILESKPGRDPDVSPGQWGIILQYTGMAPRCSIKDIVR